MDKSSISFYEASRGFYRLRYHAWLLQRYALKLPPTLMESDFFDSEPAKKVLAEMQNEITQVYKDVEAVDHYLSMYWTEEMKDGEQLDGD